MAVFLSYTSLLSLECISELRNKGILPHLGVGRKSHGISEPHAPRSLVEVILMLVLGHLIVDPVHHVLRLAPETFNCVSMPKVNAALGIRHVCSDDMLQSHALPVHALVGRPAIRMYPSPREYMFAYDRLQCFPCPVWDYRHEEVAALRVNHSEDPYLTRDLWARSALMSK